MLYKISYLNIYILKFTVYRLEKEAELDVSLNSLVTSSINHGKTV